MKKEDFKTLAELAITAIVAFVLVALIVYTAWHTL